MFLFLRACGEESEHVAHGVSYRESDHRIARLYVNTVDRSAVKKQQRGYSYGRQNNHAAHRRTGE